VVELPFKVEEVMRLLVSGGLVGPTTEPWKTLETPPLAASRTEPLANPKPTS
jgi:hypothetical protein